MNRTEEVEARLNSSGGPFELVEEEVLGAVVRVYKERARSLRELLETSAGFGAALYIVSGERRITYAQHARIVASVARGLAERYGVTKGDRVAILAANHPEWIIAFWASTSLGAICVGLNGWWVKDEILFGIRDCDPKLLIGDRRRLARLAGEDIGIPIVEIESDFVKLWNHAPEAPLPDVPIAEDDPATILYTSGTTGRPKGAVTSHRNLVMLTRMQINHGLRNAMLAPPASPTLPPLPPCALTTTPLFHVSGLFNGVVTSLATGMKTVWTPPGPFDPRVALELIAQEKVTIWGPTGTMLHRVVNFDGLEDFDLSSIRNVGSGGAPVPAPLQERMRRAFPNSKSTMGIGYGLTESTALISINSGETLEQHPDSVGRPLPSWRLEIRDEAGRALPDGEDGEIHVRGPLVMNGYWGRPEATAETIKPGRWLATGDIGRIENGLLFINSRKRDLILRGGENIYPVEIEQCLEAHPAVVEVAVFGVDHEELGQEVKAVVVHRQTDRHADRPDAAALTDWCASRLAYFKVPVHWEFGEEPLPRNASGKVMKHVLAAGALNPFVEE